MERPRLLYLSFAFPPGVQELHPGVNPAGHLFETEMASGLQDYFDFRSAGVLPFKPEPAASREMKSRGINHKLILLDRRPEMFHRFQSLRALRRQYLAWEREGWRPEAILVYNTSPIYNCFVRWLRRRGNAPKLVLLFADSSRLGQRLSWRRKLRYKLKPFFISDDEMITLFDGCIGLSRTSEQWFRGRAPWLWMPGACSLPGTLLPKAEPADERVVFGYFGSLGAHSGIQRMISVLRQTDLPNQLHICGYGKQAEEIRAEAARDARIVFHGLLDRPEDCLRLAQKWDVLVNPKPADWGNDNSFPSKLFQYALAGRAILTSRLSGVEEVLGLEGFCFEAEPYEANLRASLENIARLPREELRRRGAALKARIEAEYSWPSQTQRISQFIREVIQGPLPNLLRPV